MPIILPVGRSALRGLARFCAGVGSEWATLLSSIEEGKADASSSIDLVTVAALASAWVAHAPDEALEVPELRALALWADRAGADYDPLQEVRLLVLDERAYDLAARIIGHLTPQSRRMPTVVLLSFLNESDSETNAFERAVKELVRVLVNSPPGPHDMVVLLADPPAPLTSTVTMVAERAAVSVFQLMEGIDGPRLLPIALSGIPGQDGAASATTEVQRWTYLPHAVRLARLVEWRGVDDSTLRAMAERTRTWVDGDVWQADLLPHMVHHGRDHGRNVDVLATDLLRICPFVDDLNPSERAMAVQALSAAAWLHDLGQRGGRLKAEYVSDYAHVRKFHGLLTRRLLEDEPVFEELKIQGRGLRLLVGHLCKCHQRNARLHREDAKAVAPCHSGCRVCGEAAEMLDSSLLEEIAREHEQTHDVVIAPQVAVLLGAILRVADAADIGVHRVNGRWDAHTRSVEQAWRREYLRSALPALESRLSDIERGTLYQMLISSRWEQADINTLCRLLEEAGQSDTAHGVKSFDRYLREQAKHVAKHRPFRGARIVKHTHSTFRIELLPSSAWPADKAAREAAAYEAFGYIWGEYLHSAAHFDQKYVRTLDAVVAPDGMPCHRDRGFALCTP